LDRNPPPGVELGMPSGNVDVGIRSFEQHCEPFLPLTFPSSAPGGASKLLRHVVIEPPSAFGDDHCLGGPDFPLSIRAAPPGSASLPRRCRLAACFMGTSARRPMKTSPRALRSNDADAGPILIERFIMLPVLVFRFGVASQVDPHCVEHRHNLAFVDMIGAPNLRLSQKHHQVGFGCSPIFSRCASRSGRPAAGCFVGRVVCRGPCSWLCHADAPFAATGSQHAPMYTIGVIGLAAVPGGTPSPLSAISAQRLCT
jgi:hypothetical protein